MAIENILNIIQNELGAQIKVLRSDNRTKFLNSQCRELFQSLGVLHQSSFLYTPRQNGVVEKKNIDKY